MTGRGTAQHDDREGGRHDEGREGEGGEMMTDGAGEGGGRGETQRHNPRLRALARRVVHVCWWRRERHEAAAGGKTTTPACTCSPPSRTSTTETPREHEGFFFLCIFIYCNNT
jgi:hypothetical protein